MKKLFLSLATAIIASMTVHAQTQVATLLHDGGVKVYYGSNALKSAVEAAASGDVITLSSGSFTACKIDKSLTIRGAGMTGNSQSGTRPTIIAGEAYINIPTDDGGTSVIEGVMFKDAIKTLYEYKGLKNITFTKCTICELTLGSSSQTIENVNYINCRLSSVGVGNGTATYMNSVVYNSGVGANASAEFKNCVVIFVGGSYKARAKNSSFTNCLLYAVSPDSYSTAYDATNSYENCVAHEYTYKQATPAIGNNSLMGTDRFKALFVDSSNLTDYISASYTLTDEARAQYLGTDGSEVGIYGGTMPFNETPSNPQITKVNVAQKTTTDGKLSIELEVNSGE